MDSFGEKEGEKLTWKSEKRGKGDGGGRREGAAPSAPWARGMERAMARGREKSGNGAKKYREVVKDLRSGTEYHE
jgi:hypothetical protein